jgi:hypothetical protein
MDLPADFRPLNPWGRAMPKSPRPDKHDLYQLIVWDISRRQEVRVGPQMAQEFVEGLAAAMRAEIAAGRDQRWSDPTVVCTQKGNL